MDERRDLPAVHRVLCDPALAALTARLGAAAVKAATAATLSAARAGASRRDDVVADVARRLEQLERQGLVRVLNATGIVLHTNLGRAPLAPAALRAIETFAAGYVNVEYDLDAGARGSRYERVSALLCEATGAEDALVVNNCAAAVLLALDTLARRAEPEARPREVIVSRNQLIEIGGGFRLPDVLARSGARLVEVGTTNRVYLRDFEAALSARTALLLRSHTSNYTIEGFTADVAPRELAALGRRAGVPTMEDLGGGALVSLAPYGLPAERTAGEAIADGIDLVAFSGDKLLGGPQAGILVGGAAPIARMRASPLLRALRVDKATLAALGATLRLHATPEGRATIPFYAMLGATPAALRVRAEAVAAAIGAGAGGVLAVDVVATEAYAGGGSAPTAPLASVGLSLRHASIGASALAKRLRLGRPAVVGRTAEDVVTLDVRTIAPEEDAELAVAVRAAAGLA